MRNIKFKQKLLICNESPPLISGAKDFVGGILQIFSQVIKFLSFNNFKLINADVSSPHRLAIAAPQTPMPSTWIKIGSENMVTKLDIKVILTDVLTSIVPRKAEKPTNANSIGKKLKALILKYGVATSRAGDPAFRIDFNALAGQLNINVAPNVLINIAKKRA